MLKCAYLLIAGLLLVGCLLSLNSQAGDKKADKKDEPGKSEQIFSKSDELTDKDEKDTSSQSANSRRKVYKVKLIADKYYQIDLKSSDFDAFLRLENAQGKELAANDNAAGAPTRTSDSRIIFKAAKTEEHRIIATAIRPKNGKFTLTVVESDTAPVVNLFKGKAIELTLKNGKARYEGELTAKDAVVYGRPYKVFTVTLEEGKTYHIDHRNNGDNKKFDAYLFLEDSSGVRVAADDDSGGGRDARITHKVAKTAAFRVIATTLNDKSVPTTGKFALEITEELKTKAKTK